MYPSLYFYSMRISKNAIIYKEKHILNVKLIKLNWKEFEKYAKLITFAAFILMRLYWPFLYVSEKNKKENRHQFSALFNKIANFYIYIYTPIKYIFFKNL